MHTYSTAAGRLNKFAGQILKHAVPLEVLARGGRQVKFPKNSSATYVARRWLPYGGTTANNGNQFFSNGTGDRGNTMVQAHLVQEGVTGNPESITPQDVEVTMQQFSCLYGFTDKTYDLYEDDVPQAMQQIVGERVALVNEMILFGGLRASTNQYYGGTGTSRATVNGKLTLPLIRKIVQGLQANHGMAVSSMLKASGDYGSDAVAAGYFVYCHTDLEPDIRDLPNFTPVEKYATGEAQPNEIGKCERFRFIASPELIPYQDAGAAVGSLGLYSTSLSNIDVYPIIVSAKDAWSQVAVRGKESVDPTYLPPKEKTKSDPHGQRGYAGAIWWKAMMIENPGWLAVANVGRTAL